jgi:N-methylhydantoinase A
MGWLVGIDVGGTFTDFVAHDRDSGTVEVWKGFSTPADPADGILAGLERFAGKDRIEQLRIGTTIATNAILERKGAVVAYVTTRGFRDVPFIQRGNRKYHYGAAWVKPAPLVLHRHCFELDERIDAQGRVVKPLDVAEVAALVARIRAMPEIEAVAVCLLFSYLEPTHERRVGELFASLAPGLPVSLSSQVLPRWKEYERASTTIADAYLRPRVSGQLARLEQRLRAATPARAMVVMKSNGGSMGFTAAAASPVHMTVSGPTGGVVAARHIAAATGLREVVTLDMGGTSTDCSAIVAGRESLTTGFEIEWGLPIQIPMIDIHTIGAGGGSIAWIDKGGLLRVGPHSAGADPGPACYGKGGREATVTDANLILGRLDPAAFLGGAVTLDRDAAERAVAAVAARIGKPVDETALAIVQIADNLMVGALRAVLIERGLDPRRFTLLAFGGAGPLHAGALLRAMRHRAAIVPRHPGQLSAFGFTAADARVDRQRTVRLTSRDLDLVRLNAVITGLVDEALAEIAAQAGGGEVRIERSIEARYLGQNHELELPVTLERFDASTAEAMFTSFDQLHEARFGFANPGETIELVNVAVTATVVQAKPELRPIEPATAPFVPVATRRVMFAQGWQMAPVIRREDLRAGHRIDGPAVIEEAASVTPLAPGLVLEVDRLGQLVVTEAAG